LTSHTLTPSIVLGKKLGFADPYLGVGGQFASGSLNLLTNVLLNIDASIIKTSKVFIPSVFGGILLHVPIIGLLIVPEGSYSPSGIYSFAVRLGFTF
jgi:hypothetical protein